MDPEVLLKTTFTASWGTFTYVKMPFGLMNARATFQRAVDLAFTDINYIFIVIYFNDLTIYLKKTEEYP